MSSIVLQYLFLSLAYALVLQKRRMRSIMLAMTTDRLYKVEEVAEIFQVDPMTVRRWVKAKLTIGEDYFKPGREYRITEAGIRKLRGETISDSSSS
jgi:hypothetical protein